MFDSNKAPTTKLLFPIDRKLPFNFDLVLLNPPFHQGHVVTDHIALHLFKQASRCLSNDGELWVVGNRHLGYHQSLKQFFKKVDCVVSNAKFIVLRCSNPKGLAD